MVQNMIFASWFTDFFGKYGTIILMVAAVGVMFIFMFRSQKKQEKQANDMRNNLQVGDEITTIGGIIGEIVRIKDETVTIETGKDRTKIRILRTAIRSVDVHATDKYGTPAPAAAPAEQPKEAEAKIEAKAEEKTEPKAKAKAKAKATKNAETEVKETENK